MPTLAITTKPGKKYRSLRKPKVYEALRRRGYSKQSAARISNAQAKKKEFTVAQLEAFVSSDAYDAATAGLIALGVPALPSLKGEQIAPGITRIHGNLCNVHGRYGPCDKSLSGKKPKGGKGRKPAKPKQTPAQRAQARDAEHQANRGKTLSAQGYSPADQTALEALRSGAQPTAVSQGLIDQGVVEQASDGSYRLSSAGRALMNAAGQADAGRARDTVSGSRDRLAARRARQAAAAKRQQDSASKRAAATMGRELSKREREQERAKRQAEAAKKPSGGGKKPEKMATEKPLKASPAKRMRRSSSPSSTGGIGVGAGKKPAKPAKQIAPALTEAATALSQGKQMTDEQVMALVRNGLVKLNKDGVPVLTAAGQRAAQVTTKAQTDQEKAMFAKMGGSGGGGGKSGGSKLWPKGPSGKRTPQAAAAKKRQPPKSKGNAKTKREIGDLEAKKRYILSAPHRANDPMHQASLRKIDARLADLKKTKDFSFQVFKDASGRYRWVAQSSTAFQDRDKEIVSTKALADDCAFADETGSYGPLRWWHTPGLDLGDCDFNAMHGRVLIESGTFKSEAIAVKVAQAAPQLEISLGFLHLPTEPDAGGVFHHIRRFERSLVPRGKASNRFTAFRVKEIPMLDATKVAALKTLGFSDDDITNLQSTAAATEKAATDQGVAYKADEPADLPDVVINGVTYKAMPPSPPTEAEAVVEEDAMGEMPMEEEPAGGLTLSPEDLQAIGAAIGEQMQGIAAQIMGALDLEKKVAGHVQGLMAPYQQAQATKDASDAERTEQIATLQASLKAAEDQQATLKTQLNELLGLQPEVQPRASEGQIVNPWIPQDAQLLESIKNQVSPNDQFAFGDLVQNLFGNQTPGQA